jgi:translation elongation factor EF-G
LKSLTGGEGSYSLVLDHYESVPATIQKSLEEQFRPSAE